MKNARQQTVQNELHGLQGKDVALHLEKKEHLSLPGYSTMAANALVKVRLDSDEQKQQGAVRQALDAVQTTPVDAQPVDMTADDPPVGNSAPDGAVVMT